MQEAYQVSLISFKAFRQGGSYIHVPYITERRPYMTTRPFYLRVILFMNLPKCVFSHRVPRHIWGHGFVKVEDTDLKRRFQVSWCEIINNSIIRDGPFNLKGWGLCFFFFFFKYSDFGGGKKNNLIQSFCHIT